MGRILIPDVRRQGWAMTDAGGQSPEGELRTPDPTFELPGASPMVVRASTDESALDLAGYGIRLAGYMLDGVLVLMFAGVLLLMAPRLNSALLSVLGAVLGLLYAGILIGAWNGQTIGMKAMGTRCVNASDGSKVSMSTSLKRALMHAVFVIIWPLSPVDLAWPIWDKRNQTIHDKVASTVVVKV